MWPHRQQPTRLARPWDSPGKNTGVGCHFLLQRDLWTFPFYCFPLFLCIDHWGRLSYLSLLFFGTLHSNGYIFSFLHCFLLLFFTHLFVRPPQTVILLFCISFSWGWSWSLSSIECHEPPSIVHQALCLSDLVISHKKEWNNTICSNMDTLGNCHTEWS